MRRPKPSIPVPSALRTLSHHCHVLLLERATFEGDIWDIAEIALGRMPRAERRRLAEEIGNDLDHGRTFAEVHDGWLAGRIDRYDMVWHDAVAFRDFLLRIRATIDPHAWTIPKPAFRPAD